MAKKAKKTKEESLETILFNCRNSLRGKAQMTDKRDLLLTLVFLKFIGDRFEAQRTKIIGEFKNEFKEQDLDEGYLQMQLNKPWSYQKDGVFFLPEECQWNKLVELKSSDMALAFDKAIATLDQNEPKLKNALPLQIFTNTQLEAGVIRSVVDEVNKISNDRFPDRDLIGRVYEYFLQAFSINADKEEGEFYTPILSWS